MMDAMNTKTYATSERYLLAGETLCFACHSMESYNTLNAHWARVDALLRRNPFGDMSMDSPALKMVYMAAYNLDTFRRFVLDSSFLARFEVPGDRLEKVRTNDTELLRLGFDWVLRFLGGQGPLKDRSCQSSS